MRSNTMLHLSPRFFFLLIFAIVFSGHLISASPVPLPGNSNTDAPFLGLLKVNKGNAKASYPLTTASISNPAQECTLIESAPHHPINIDPASRKVGYYELVPEPDPRRYIPIYSRDPTLAPGFPVGVRQKRKFPCQRQIIFIDHEDEKRPAATGILCSMPNPIRPGAPQRDFHTNMMTKIIRNVHLELDDRDNVHLPLRIKWEIDMLHKTQKLGSSLLPQWQYYVDPQSIKSAVTPGGMRAAVGEVYITIAPEDGAILRELRDYQDLKTPEDRKRFLDHIKFLVVHKIITYAVTYGVFHVNLNLGNLYIVPRMKFVPMPANPKPVAILSHYEVNFSDWGYPRKVIQSFNTCDDPWLVPGFMVYPDAQGQPPQFVTDYVNEVFKVAEKHIGAEDWKGGVNSWTHPW